jgi:hypothetical protein
MIPYSQSIQDLTIEEEDLYDPFREVTTSHSTTWWGCFGYPALSLEETSGIWSGFICMAVNHSHLLTLLALVLTFTRILCGWLPGCTWSGWHNFYSSLSSFLMNMFFSLDPMASPLTPCVSLQARLEQAAPASGLVAIPKLDGGLGVLVTWPWWVKEQHQVHQWPKPQSCSTILFWIKRNMFVCPSLGWELPSVWRLLVPQRVNSIPLALVW